MTQHHVTYDHSLLCKDAGAIAASAAATVGAVARVITFGEGRMDGCLIVDTTAVEVATGDELYGIEVQLSDVADFTAGSPKIKVAAALQLGDSSKTGMDADSPAAGHYELPFSNEYNGVIYPYARVYTRVGGTVTTGIDYVAYMAKVMATA